MWVDKVVGIVAPHDCVVCGKQGQIICRACIDSVPVAKRSTCYLCNKLTPNWRTCSSCRPKTKLSGVVVASHYEGNVKLLIKKLKYERTMAAAKPLAAISVGQLRAEDYDVVTSIPSSTKRFRQRGYNPASLIARSISRQLNLPYQELLGRLGQERQVGTKRGSRIKQISGHMYALNLAKIDGKRILVVDDVVTTGATMSEAGRALHQAGAKKIWGLAVAKH